MTSLATSASPIAVWFGAVYLTQKFASPALLENDGAANLTWFFFIALFVCIFLAGRLSR